jgi:hypothetical protein
MARGESFVERRCGMAACVPASTNSSTFLSKWTRCLPASSTKWKHQLYQLRNHNFRAEFLPVADAVIRKLKPGVSQVARLSFPRVSVAKKGVVV